MFLSLKLAKNPVFEEKNIDLTDKAEPIAMHHKTQVRLFLLLMMFLTPFITSSAQGKLEIERSIKPQEVPQAARDWIERAIESPPHINWIHETTNEKESIEAKFKWNKQFYSVEFDIDGVLEDIEKTIPLKTLSKSVRKNLSDYFKSNYKNSNIEKIQIQYTGQSDTLEAIFSSNSEPPRGVTIQYEIIYYGKDDAGKNIWEGLFDEAGEFIQKHLVILPSADNMNF